MHKKILLTGVNGQVGQALKNQLLQYEVIALSRNQLDLTSIQNIRHVVREVKPDLIINPAAYTAVDKAESEPELAYAINGTAPQILAEEAARLGAALIHFSTDYVYDGTKESVYIETDIVNPLSVYGKSKLMGEDGIRSVGLPHLILRTSWVYGIYGSNFLKTILRLATDQDCLRLVDDQFGAPTSAECIAEAMVNLLKVWGPKQNQSGIFHFTNTGGSDLSGYVSWYGFSQQIFNEYNLLASVRNWPTLKASKIEAITTSQYPSIATRPINSMLSNAKLKDTFNIELPTWQQGLKQVMHKLTF